MGNVIFSDFGCTILRRDGRYFIRYDSGEIASWLLENEISAANAEKAKKSEEDAYEVILSAEREREPRRVADANE